MYAIRSYYEKEVLKFRSNRSIVIPPASTGSEDNNKNDVTTTLQTKSLTLSKLTSLPRKLQKVVIKLILLRILPTPARCREKILKSTEEPPCPRILLRGG